MSANYWTSTQHSHWIFTRQSLQQARQETESHNTRSRPNKNTNSASSGRERGSTDNNNLNSLSTSHDDSIAFDTSDTSNNNNNNDDSTNLKGANNAKNGRLNNNEDSLDSFSKISTGNDKGLGTNLIENRHIRIYLHHLVLTLGQHLSIRQRVLATAQTYLLRLYTRISLYELNPYLVVTTCVYLACKIEESPQHVRTITNEARNLWPDYITHDPTKVAECEFYLIEELETYLIVHHPYRSLLQIIKNLESPVLGEFVVVLLPEEIQIAWSIINDSYITDLHLLFSPHVIAISCLYITVILKSYLIRVHQPPDSIKTVIQNFIKFIGESNFSLECIIECVQEMLSLYSSWETYEESVCKSAIEQILLQG
ncbi:cyclin-like protein [Nadsonia fulvescens var. elongata DSM 6958]|uniref:Cyclin-like protein n=1 Tax=Nadsonia fulvescens var. elongata DSM 6958 TaxID=857566 RepID=A0A1E3PPC6_9ASCO|nr:cyclin-like protein [Nadsonia fulvescens var. elongata DSM 6958]